MIRVALAAAMLFSAWPADAARRYPRRIDDIAAELDLLAAEQKDLHPLEARRLEVRMRALGEEVRRMGAEAIEPLAALLADRRRPLKARLYCAEFIGLNGDPSAYEPLKRRALDASEDPGVRSVALQALGSIRVSTPEKRRILEAALGAEEVPPAVRSEALEQLADTGVSDAALIHRAASLPGLKEGDARNAALALERSRSPDAAGRLIELLPLVLRLSEGEVEALGALSRLPPAKLTPRQTAILLDVLHRRRGQAAALAARVIGKFRLPEAPDELRRALQAEDPQVVTEAAEALASLRDPNGAKEIDKVVARLPRDDRFSPGKGDDTAALATRMHLAANEARAPLPAPAPAPRPAPAPVPERLPEPPPAPAPTPEPKALPKPPQEEARRGAFRLDGFPGENRPEIRWRGGEAKLYDRPDPAARSQRVRLEAGLLRWGSSVVWTLQAGEAAVKRKLTLSAQDLGPFTGRYAGGPGRARKATLEPGESLVLLGERGAGECLVRRRNRLLAMECPQYYPGPYEVRSLPVTEWWVHVEHEGGRGWMTVAYQPGTNP